MRSLYNGFVSCFYPDVNALAEEYRCWSHASGHYYKIPDEARFVDRVCDLLVMEHDDELWLASGTPGRWLELGNKIAVNGAHTVFGEVSYTLQPGARSETIEADVQLPSRSCKEIWFFVRAPYAKPIKQVTVNGQVWQHWDVDRQAVLVPQQGEKVHIQVTY